jgi:hypothetical protein
MDNCEELKELVRSQFINGIKVRALKGGKCLLQIPFYDSDGDPIRMVVHKAENSIILNDAGAIVGSLFTLGQHAQDTPSFKLLSNLEKAYGLHIGFDSGLITAKVEDEREMFDAIANFGKVIMTMLTAIPHIRVEPHRLKPLGQRLKAKIKDQYSQANILDLVEHDYLLSGKAVENWPIDFHWWIKENGREEQIYVVTVDLNVREPLVKAAKVTTLALDAQRSTDYDKLRIVIDSHGANSNATIAGSLVRQHSDKLKYSVYDFEKEDERIVFVNQSVREITSDMGEAWRDFWQKQRALT